MAPAHKFTSRREEVLGAIELAVIDQGRPPTVRELGAALGISSTNGVARHLKHLAREGRIVVEPLASRGIALVGKSRPDTLLARLATAVACDLALARSETIAPILADCVAYLQRVSEARRAHAVRKGEAAARVAANKQYGLKTRRRAP